MKKIILYKLSFFLFLLVLSCFSTQAQKENYDQYHRSSIYSILLRHPQQTFSEEIVKAFKSIPLPDRYNNHNLKFTVMDAPIIRELSKEEIEGAYKDAILNMLNRNKVGGRMVGKWFNRDAKTGAFDMELVKSRGLYDASILDINMAMHSVRGKAMLEDAGEELLGHTYILVNDIRYADKKTKRNLQGFALMAGLFGSVLLGPVGVTMAKSAWVNGVQINDLVVGFKVFVTSYLFRLDWNQEMANEFFSTMWTDKTNPDSEKKQLFKQKMSHFNLSYLGCTTVYSGETSLAGVEYEDYMFKKVCSRSIDKAVSELQKSFDEFKVFAPLASTLPLKAYIGRKEGVTEDNLFEVVELTEDELGKKIYTRVGVIKPIKDKIWDNRYMANFEKDFDKTIDGTLFQKVSGGDFELGMLIREINE